MPTDHERVYAGFLKEPRRVRLGCGCEGAFVPERMSVLLAGAEACARHQRGEFFMGVAVQKADLLTVLPYLDESKLPPISI